MKLRMMMAMNVHGNLVAIFNEKLFNRRKQFFSANANITNDYNLLNHNWHTSAFVATFIMAIKLYQE